MIVSDQVIWIMTALFAFICSLETFDLPASGIYAIQTADQDDASDVESLFGVGRVFTKMRMVFFPGLAAGLWFIMSVLSISINNCDFSFGVCFTSPSYQTTTATISQFSYGSAFGLFFALLGIAFVIITLIAGISIFALHQKAIGKGNIQTRP